MEGLTALVPDPRLAVLFNPAVLVFLASIIVGLVQATRSTHVESNWLPIISGGWGVVVAVLVTFATGVTFTSAVLSFMVLYGLGIGLSATGAAALAIHFNTGSTDGASTMARHRD